MSFVLLLNISFPVLSVSRGFLLVNWTEQYVVEETNFVLERSRKRESERGERERERDREPHGESYSALSLFPINTTMGSFFLIYAAGYGQILQRNKLNRSTSFKTNWTKIKYIRTRLERCCRMRQDWRALTSSSIPRLAAGCVWGRARKETVSRELTFRASLSRQRPGFHRRHR